MNSKIRIAFCFSSSLSNVYGGGEKVLSDLLGNIDTQKFDVSLVIEHPHIHEKYLSRFSNRVKVVPIYSRLVGYYKKSVFDNGIFLKWQFFPPGFLFRALAKNILYKSMLKKIAVDYDVVVDHDPFSFIKHFSRYNIVPKALVIGWHHTDHDCFLRLTQNIKRGMRNPLLLMNALFFVSDHIRQQSLDYIASVKEDLALKTYFTPNGIDVEQVLYSAEHGEPEFGSQDSKLISSKYILMVARVTKTKGHKTAVEAFCKIKHLIPNYNLIFIGAYGDAHDELKAMVKDYNAEDKIYFLGVKSNPYIWIKHCQMMLLCSIAEESFGLVVVEAMIFDKLVIVSDLPQLVATYGNGPAIDYFKAGDSTNLALKISSYVHEQLIELRAGHVEYCRQIRDHYSLGNATKIFEECVFKVIKSSEIVDV